MVGIYVFIFIEDFISLKIRTRYIFTKEILVFGLFDFW